MPTDIPEIDELDERKLFNLNISSINVLLYILL